jgi:hypothetical protein
MRSVRPNLRDKHRVVVENQRHPGGVADRGEGFRKLADGIRALQLRAELKDAHPAGKHPAGHRDCPASRHVSEVKDSVEGRGGELRAHGMTLCRAVGRQGVRNGHQWMTELANVSPPPKTTRRM